MFNQIEEKAQKNKSKNVYIFTHSNPDGDAIGSAMAMKAYLKKLGLNGEIVLSEDCSRFKFNFGLLPKFNGTVDKNGVGIILDSSTEDVIESPLYKSIAKENLFLIDHHLSQENATERTLGLNPENVIRNADSSSTCEILAGLMEKSKIDPTIANNLIFGICKDTHDLEHAKKPATFDTTADLIECGGNFNFIRNSGTVKVMPSVLKEQAEMFGDFQKVELPDGRFIAYVPVPYEKASKATMPLIQKKIFTLADMEGCVAYFAGVENKPGKFDFEFRSSVACGDLDVSKLAIENGGGGHRGASGATIESDKKVDELCADFAKKLSEEYEVNGDKSIRQASHSKENRLLANIIKSTNYFSRNVYAGNLRNVAALMRSGADYDILSKRTIPEKQVRLGFDMMKRYKIHKTEVARQGSRPVVQESASLVLKKSEVEKIKAAHNVTENDILLSFRKFDETKATAASLVINTEEGPKACVGKRLNGKWNEHLGVDYNEAKKTFKSLPAIPEER